MLALFSRTPCEAPGCKNRGTLREDFEASLCNTHAGIPSYTPRGPAKVISLPR